MALPDLSGDVALTGDQIREFCDYLERDGAPRQAFEIGRLRSASRITRQTSLGQSEFRVTLSHNRGITVVPILGVA